MVYASPGVPPEHELLQAARERGIRLSSLIELFFALCPAPILGVTGSAGKSTTTSLIGDIFDAAGRDVFVGGNIGRPLLGKLEQMSASSWVVMELSSFQLEPLQVSPHIALVTNVTPEPPRSPPEHGGVLAGQRPDPGPPVADRLGGAERRRRVERCATGRASRVLRFSLEGVVDGAYLAGEQLMLLGEPLLEVAEVPLRGRHNLANVLAACAGGARRGDRSRGDAGGDPRVSGRAAPAADGRRARRRAVRRRLDRHGARAVDRRAAGVPTSRWC